MTGRTASLRGVRLPPDVLRETFDEVVACGSQRAVAQAHGWHQAKVRSRVLSWMRHAGIEGPVPGIVSPSHVERGGLSHSGQGDRSAWKRAADRVIDLEREVAALRARLALLESEARPFARLEAKLDALLARPAVTPVTHRRIRDGGVGGRAERRRVA